MGAPKGNQFWKLRSKHGRDKLFATPDLLWEAACEYFEWCDENPFYEAEQKKGNTRISFDTETTADIKDAIKEIRSNIVQLPKMRPYTLYGLCIYLDCCTGYFREFKKDCSKDFVSVITRIEEVIYNQKFSGAASGFLNPNIIARDLGLKDHSDITSDNEKIQSLNVTVDKSETAETLKKLRDGG